MVYKIGDKNSTNRFDFFTDSYFDGWMDNWIYFLVVNGVAIAVVHHNQTILIDAFRNVTLIQYYISNLLKIQCML